MNQSVPARLVRCRYLKGDSNQCTAEAAMPFADVLLCVHHIAGIMDDARIARRLRMPERDAARLDAAAAGRRQRDALIKVAGLVYYGEAWGYIKIGTSVNIESRAKGLKLTKLLATEPGSYKLEMQRHKMFKEHLAVGEYYHPAPEILAHIEEVKRKHGPPITTQAEQLERARHADANGFMPS